MGHGQFRQVPADVRRVVRLREVPKVVDRVVLPGKVAELHRVREHEEPARREHPGGLGHDGVLRLGGQLVEEVNRGHDVEGAGLERQGLGVGLHEGRCAERRGAILRREAALPVGVVLPRLLQVVGAQVGCRHIHCRPIVADEGHDAARATSDLQKLLPTTTWCCAIEVLCDVHQRAALHRVLAPQEERLGRRLVDLGAL
mmetsp:Transcript_60206/g.166631  ORF Transcript_60206/g.166631 Transcript_60206/m.166631 type:complete len:200 (+) Transcript_60206:341-940(+)